MEKSSTRSLPYKMIIIGIGIAILVIIYSFRNTDVIEIDDEETMVSLCQVRVQFDGPETFDDRILLSLLVTLKMHDFYIGQPVVGPADTLLYLCEHRLKIGFNQSRLERELQNVMTNGPILSGRLAWTCA